jgi:hypothetical protein
MFSTDTRLQQDLLEQFQVFAPSFIWKTLFPQKLRPLTNFPKVLTYLDHFFTLENGGIPISPKNIISRKKLRIKNKYTYIQSGTYQGFFRGKRDLQKDFFLVE